MLLHNKINYLIDNTSLEIPVSYKRLSIRTLPAVNTINKLLIIWNFNSDTDITKMSMLIDSLTTISIRKSKKNTNFDSLQSSRSKKISYMSFPITYICNVNNSYNIKFAELIGVKLPERLTIIRTGELISDLNVPDTIKHIYTDMYELNTTELRFTDYITLIHHIQDDQPTEEKYIVNSLQEVTVSLQNLIYLINLSAILHNSEQLLLPYIDINNIDFKQMHLVPEFLMKRIHKLYTNTNTNTNTNTPIYIINSIINSEICSSPFEHVYIMTIERLKNRYQRTIKLMRKHGLHNSNIQTHYGYDAKQETQNQSQLYLNYCKYLKQPLSQEELQFKQRGIKSLGSWCILHCFRDILIKAQTMNYQNILMLQDDLLFHKDFKDRLHKYMKLIPRTWKLIYLGASQHTWPNNFKSDCWYYHPAGTADGAFAVAIHQSVYQELIDEIDKKNLPVDTGALRTIQKRYYQDCYVLYPNLIIADIRISDLRHKRLFETTGQHFKWDTVDYDIPIETTDIT